MKRLLRIEDFFLFLLSIFLFTRLTYAWWLYPLFLLAPDISMLGYLINPKIGAYSYNFIHHRGLAVAIYLLGYGLNTPVLLFSGLIMLGHSSLDRVFGYGLKHTDSFQHTHMGWIGGAERMESDAQ